MFKRKINADQVDGYDASDLVKKEDTPAKGDLVTGAGSSAIKKLSVSGNNGYVLSEDSTADGGVSWQDRGVTNGDSHDHSGGDGAQISHADLGSLQGGTTGEYYHLTAAEYAALGGGVGMTIETLTGSGNWTVPDDVYLIWFSGSAPGGGGGGGAASQVGVTSMGAGGGGAGATAKDIPIAVTPGQVIAYDCGTAGTGGTGGTAGGNGNLGTSATALTFGSYISLGGGMRGAISTGDGTTHGAGGDGGIGAYGDAGGTAGSTIGRAGSAPTAYHETSTPGSGGGAGGANNGAYASGYGGPARCSSNATYNNGGTAVANGGGCGGGGGNSDFGIGGMGGASNASAAGGDGEDGTNGGGGGGGAGGGLNSKNGGNGGDGGAGIIMLRH